MIRTVLFNVITLYIITLISAAPKRFQKSECSDEQLRVHVNITESDREGYHINRTKANSLLECTRKCYNDPHCFSLKYRELDSSSCVLTGFASEYCHKITSVPAAKIKYDTNTLITIDCIKCKLTEQLDEKELQTSSEPNDNDEPSFLLLGEPFDDVSLQSLSTMQNTIDSVPTTDICGEPSAMRCHEDIWFIAEEETNLASFEFLEERSTTNSVQECAEKCFHSCCKMAVYSSTEKKCQFIKENRSRGDDNCETKSISSYVNQYNGSNWIKIACMVCGLSSLRSNRHMLKVSAGDFLNTEMSIRLKEENKNEKVEKVSEFTELSQSSSLQQPIIASALDTFNSLQDKQQSRLNSQFIKMACIVMFEVDLEANIANFKAEDSVKVDRADHCAYLCYRDACTAAVFIPSTAPGNKGTCERRFDIAEKCNATLRRDYYYKTTKSIYLQCFRCLPEKPQTKSSLEIVTPQPETSFASLKKHSFEAVIQTKESDELVKTTLMSDVEPKAVEMESKEIKKDVETAATNKNMKTSSDTKQSEEITQTEGTSPIETTQTFTIFDGKEQTETTTENVTDRPNENETSVTAISTNTENIELTTSESMIDLLISDNTFKSNLANLKTEFGTEIFASVLSTNPAIGVGVQSTFGHKSIHATGSEIQALESVHQPTAENEEPTSARTEEFHTWHKPATEARASNAATSLRSEPKMELDRTKPAGVSSTENEDREDVEGIIKKSEGKVEQFGSSTITLISANEEIDGSDRSWTEANSREEMKETGILDETRWSTTAVHTDGNTKAKSSNGEEEGEGEATVPSNLSTVLHKSTLTLSKEKKDDVLPTSRDVVETFHTYLQGCIVMFQVDSHSKRPAESSTGFQASTIARTAEVCAGRCYQDGCTGAKYDPSSKECVLGYSGKQICNNGPEHFFYEANETIWIHCTGCKLHKPGDQGINIMIHSAKEAQKVKSTKVHQTPEKKLGAALEAEKSTIHAIEGVFPETLSSSLSPLSSSAATAVVEISTEAAKVSKTITSTLEKKAEIPGEEVNTDITKTSSSAEVEESVSKEKISITTTPLQKTFSDQDCIVLFQVRPIDMHLKAEFIPTDTTSTVNECARRCYMDGCTGAKFNSVNGECLLTFGDHHQCDENEQQQHSVEGIETLWIHCISCKKQFTETTLGLLAQDETNLPVITKKSKEKENSATDESFSTSKFTKVEENFLTSVTPDVGLESAKKVKSELVIDSDETNDKIVGMVPEPSAGLESTIKGDEKIPFVTPPSFGNGSLFEAESKEQEVKSKESEGEFDTSPIVATVEEKASRSSILQSSVKLSTKHLEAEIASTATDIMETFGETSDNNELDTTVQPDLLISLTLQTPLNVPTDSSELLNITEEISGSSVVSTIAKGSATIPQTSMIKSGEWKNQKEGTTVEFQEEVEPTTVSAEITVIPILHSEVTDDIVGAVASIVANISRNVLETDVKETIGIPEEWSTETHEIVSTISSKNAIIESHIEATSANFKGTFHSDINSSIVEETALMESNIEADAALSDITNATTAETISKATFIAEETSTSTSDERNTEVTFRILEKISKEGNNDDEDLFSKSVSNSITEQPFVQANANAVIKNVAQSKDILVTGSKPAVADAAIQEEAIKKVEGEDEIIAEVAKDSSNNNKLVIQGEHMTTEPPVQAVSDLISVLSQNSKIEEVIGRNGKENGAFIVDDVNLTKDADEQIMTTDVPINQFQEDFIGNSLHNSAKTRLVDGTPARCLGRVEFEISEMEDLSQLNVTSEIMIESPAACAMKCYETANCVLAVYKPSQDDESTNAVCMLTADSAICSPEQKFIPQHKSDLSTLVISCLKCTKCHYSISMVTELTRIRQAVTVEPALSIGQCGEICWKHNCTVAQYDHRSNLCSLTSMKDQQECPQETPIEVNGDEPVLLECVRCFV